jgi:hypothetical protein
MSEPGDIPDSKAFAAGPAERDGEHHAGSNPRKAGEAGIGKGQRQQNSRENRQRKPAADELAGRKEFQWPQLASKFFKDKRGVAEEWSDGVMEYWQFPILQYSITPNAPLC